MFCLNRDKPAELSLVFEEMEETELPFVSCASTWKFLLIDDPTARVTINKIRNNISLASIVALPELLDRSFILRTLLLATKLLDFLSPDSRNSSQE